MAVEGQSSRAASRAGELVEQTGNAAVLVSVDAPSPSKKLHKPTKEKKKFSYNKG
jgi:hypothetical protein